MKYKRITVHNHPLFLGQLQVKRSRLVMAESLGRPLLRTELVHHKNENTLDDRIENLEIKSPEQHVNHHGSGMKGKHHTVETKQKISYAKTGMPNHRLGKHHTAETRKKISLAQKGRSGTRGMLGKYHSIETRKRMALGQKYHYLQQRFPGV